MRAAVILLVYAVLLVLGGLYAFMAAPPDANATTALAIPGGCAAIIIVCAAMAAAFSRNRRLGMIGIHAGIIFPLLFAGAFSYTAWARTKAAAAYPAAAAAYQEARQTDPTLEEPERRKAFFKDRGTTDHDPSYLRNTLWGLTALSIVTFVVLLYVRPRPERRGHHTEIPEVLQSEEHPLGTPTNPPPLKLPPDAH